MATSFTASPTLEDRASFFNDNAFKLGWFASNNSEGRILTTVPERWSGSWDDNLALAQQCDAAGIEFLVPVGRWKGYGGVTDHQGSSLETITWATGLLAQTKKLTVFGTVHTPLFHPLIAAKQMVTADHVSHGRFGLNIVAGWNEDEFRMFGVTQKDHEGRYALAQEWIEVVRLAWERDDFDYDGEFFHLRGVREKPKPYGGSRPVVMNAGASPNGRAFAMRNTDLFFTSVHLRTDLAAMADEVASVKAAGRELGREMELFTSVFVHCAPTRREAEEYVRYAVEECADWDAMEHLLEGRRFMVRNEHARQAMERRADYPRIALGFAIIGDPDDVARGLAEFATAGLRGVAMSAVNYLTELVAFREHVLPRLERLGLRRKKGSIP